MNRGQASLGKLALSLCALLSIHTCDNYLANSFLNTISATHLLVLQSFTLETKSKTRLVNLLRFIDFIWWLSSWKGRGHRFQFLFNFRSILATIPLKCRLTSRLILCRLVAKPSISLVNNFLHGAHVRSVHLARKHLIWSHLISSHKPRGTHSYYDHYKYKLFLVLPLAFLFPIPLLCLYHARLVFYFELAHFASGSLHYKFIMCLCLGLCAPGLNKFLETNILTEVFFVASQCWILFSSLIPPCAIERDFEHLVSFFLVRKSY